MKYDDGILNELHDAIYGNGNEPEVDYENQTINYNEDGDTYYYINTYSNNVVKSIMVCAKVKGIDNDPTISGYREVYVDNDFYSAIDYILEHMDEINESIDKQMEQKQRNMKTKF